MLMMKVLQVTLILKEMENGSIHGFQLNISARLSEASLTKFILMTITNWTLK